MALIQCQECKKEISDKAITCPNCGFPVKTQEVGIYISKDPSTITYCKCTISKIDNNNKIDIATCKEGESIYIKCNKPMKLQFKIYFKKLIQEVKPR